MCALRTDAGPRLIVSDPEWPGFDGAIYAIDPQAPRLVWVRDVPRAGLDRGTGGEDGGAL